jgi:hypothetical protein
LIHKEAKLAQSNLEQIKDHSAKPDETATVETDWSAVAAEMSVTATPDSGPLGARELQNRVASALSAPDGISDLGMEDAITPWSARRQLVFFLGAGALCWMLILAPMLL